MSTNVLVVSVDCCGVVLDVERTVTSYNKNSVSNYVLREIRSVSDQWTVKNDESKRIILLSMLSKLIQNYDFKLASYGRNLKPITAIRASLKQDIYRRLKLKVESYNGGVGILQYDGDVGTAATLFFENTFATPSLGRYVDKVISFTYNGGSRFGARRLVRVKEINDRYVLGVDCESVKPGCEPVIKRYAMGKIQSGFAGIKII